MKLNYEASEILAALTGNPNGCGRFDLLTTSVIPVYVLGQEGGVGSGGAGAGSTFSDGSRASTILGTNRIYYLAPVVQLGSVVLEDLFLTDFTGVRQGVHVSFVPDPGGFTTITPPATSLAQGSCSPMGTSNAYLTSDVTAAVLTETHAVPAGGTLHIPLRGTILDPPRLLRVQTTAPTPTDLACWVSWRNYGAKQPGGGGFTRVYRRAP